MAANSHAQNESMCETASLKSFVRNLGIDVVGIADLRLITGMPVGITADADSFLSKYRYAIVLGAQIGKLGRQATGTDVNLYLEKAALELMAYLEEQGERTLIVHTEDEFDPINRVGLLSLKVLAKSAGLGWQGRSLLIISPEYGPIHRWIAVLTNMALQADPPIRNQCGDCTACVDQCPYGALSFVPFEDHPARRADVLDINACRRDSGCQVCLLVCPWAQQPTELDQSPFST